MSSIDEQDLELLETYLDEELPQDMRASLIRRLEVEAELAMSLEALRAERFIRQQAFESLAPSEKTAQQFAWTVSSTLKLSDNAETAAVAVHPVRQSRFAGVMRMVSTVAASIVVGFLVGWATRGPWGTSSTATPTFISGATEASYRVPVRDDQGQVMALEEANNVRESRAQPDGVKLGIVFRSGSMHSVNDQTHAEVDVPALQITEVFSNSLAARSGLKTGDLIVAFGGHPIVGGQAFVTAASKANGISTMKVIRSNKLIEVPLDLRD